MAIGDCVEVVHSCDNFHLPSSHFQNSSFGNAELGALPHSSYHQPTSNQQSSAQASSSLYSLPAPSNSASFGGYACATDESDGAGDLNNISCAAENTEFLQSKPVRDVLEMGFSIDVVKIVNDIKVSETGETYFSADDLLDAVMAYQAAENIWVNETPPEAHPTNAHALSQTGSTGILTKNSLTSSHSSNQATENGEVTQKQKKSARKQNSPKKDKASGSQLNSHSNGKGADLSTDGQDSKQNLLRTSRQTLSPLSLKEENKRMKSSTVCKICMENDIRVVFLPCGHMVCCNECISLIEKCTICGSAVKGSVKVFLA